MPTEPLPDLVLRPGTREDLPAVAETYLRTRDAAVPAMPPRVHDEDDVRGWVAGWDLDRDELWVATDAEGLAGYALLQRDWLHSLYVDPARQRSGVGSALLGVVTAARPRGFALWVFASNTAARTFYGHHGLVELETTDGSGNEEGAPEVRLAWPGTDPLSFLRRGIDEVDDELGRVLARRTALTAAVQAHKPVPGQAGRDRQREREIVTRLARQAPGLGRDRLQRIVDAVITESLASVEEPGRDV